MEAILKEKKQVESAEERMLRKLGYDLAETARAIFGKECGVELTLSNAPNSKILFIQECNPSLSGLHGTCIRIDADRFTIRVGDSSLPF